MNNDRYTDPSLRNPLSTYLLGFFGAALGILVLPRLVPKLAKFITRRFVLGTISEILAIVITGLLTEKAVEALADDEASR